MSKCGPLWTEKVMRYWQKKHHKPPGQPAKNHLSKPLHKKKAKAANKKLRLQGKFVTFD